MTIINHIDPSEWYSEDKAKRLSAYANAPITETNRVYDGFNKDHLDFLEMAIWNPVIISGTEFHKPMFDNIKILKESTDIQSIGSASFDTVRFIEDISRIDLHYHELIHDAFGCDVNDIDEHNTDADWAYRNKKVYSKEEYNNALSEKDNQWEESLKHSGSKNNKKLISNVIYLIAGFITCWLFF